MVRSGPGTREQAIPLANLVAAAVQGGMHPREWEALKSLPAERSIDPSSDFALFRPRGQLGTVRSAQGL